jgi:hypothetical protein
MQELLLDGETFSVPKRSLINSCDVFLEDPILLTSPYKVKSRVSRDSFQVFTSAIGGSEVTITAVNVRDLALLCDEFKFSTLSNVVAEWRATDTVSLAWIDDRLLSHDRAICALTQQIEALRRAQEAAAVQSVEEFSGLKSRVAQLERCPNMDDGFVRLQRDLAAIKEEMAKSKIKQFPPSLKNGWKFNIPDGIISHLTKACGGNVHDHGVVEVTSSPQRSDDADCAAKNIADLENQSVCSSARCKRMDNIPHTRNNWLCYDFKERRIMPTHYAIRSHELSSGSNHLKSWAVDASEDGVDWQEIDRRDNNNDLNGKSIVCTFTIAASRQCRFIRLVNIGRNQHGDDSIAISAWEIFGGLIG